VQNAVEALRKRELLRVGELLFAEYEDRVLVHPGSNLVERSTILDLAQIERARFGGEARLQLTERQGQCRLLEVRLAKKIIVMPCASS
jgi:hypothetical protein